MGHEQFNTSLRGGGIRGGGGGYKMFLSGNVPILLTAPSWELILFTCSLPRIND